MILKVKIDISNPERHQSFTQLTAANTKGPSGILLAMVWLAAGILSVSAALFLASINGASEATDAAGYNGPGKPLDRQDALMSEADLEQYKAVCPDYRYYSAYPQCV